MKILEGHISPETARVVDDYPYGFRLRCKIRYWLEWKKGKGFRFVSQTTNPKVTLAGSAAAGISLHPWNKPKASTYTYGLVVMAENEENGHISYTGIRYDYGDAEQLQRRLDQWRHTFTEEVIAEAEKFIRMKREYERLKAEGVDYREAAAKAVLEEHKAKLTTGATTPEAK